MDLSDPVTYVIFSGIFLALMSFYLIKNINRLKASEKKILFWNIVTPVVLSSLYLAGHTVYDNINSVTKGLIHYHADYQIWTCGQRIHFHKPQGFLNNKQGSPLLHSHEDDRIHVEGTVMSFSEITLGKFFEVTKGSLTSQAIKIYTDDGLKTYTNGDLCPNGQPGYLKVYVDGKLIQNPKDYVIKPHTYVPPGDCIIIEFSNFASPTTDKICESYTAKGVSYS